ARAVPSARGPSTRAGVGALALNGGLGLASEKGWYRWWLIYGLAVLDVLLMAVLVVWFGHGGLVAAFFLAVLPYAFDQGRGVGEFVVLVALLAFLGVCLLFIR